MISLNPFNWLKRSKMKREIIINVEKLETRVAVMENGRLEEFMVEHPEEERLVGSVFKGRVQNLENDLQAAFVDIGLKKNAFLHYWDMTPDADALLDDDDDAERRKSQKGGRKANRLSDQEIAKRFPSGSEIIVQVTKGPISTKGPRVTANLSIPGRYLVMMPGTKIRGVSKKIGDATERRRLKKILDKLPLPENVGLVVRTVGAGADRADDEPDVLGERQLVEDLLQAAALGGIADLLRDAANLRARHHDEVAAGNRKVRRHARALRRDRALRDLHDDLGAGRKALGDLLVREAVRLAPALLALAPLGIVVIVEKRVRVRRHVPVMEEGVLLQSDVDERGLQVVFEVLDAALEDAADEAFLLRMLDHELLKATVLHDGDARLELFDVDDDLALHLGALEPVERIETDHFLFFLSDWIVMVVMV